MRRVRGHSAFTLGAIGFAAPFAAVLTIVGCGSQNGGLPQAEGLVGEAPDTGCVQGSWDGGDYWFCSTQRDWGTARANCQAAGYDLATIDDQAENDYIAQNLTASSWTGASDQGNEGVWTWAESGAQFWQGGAFGSAVGGLYSEWSSFQPNNYFNQDCGVVKTWLGGGEWDDSSCELQKPYVCERFEDLCPNDPNKTIPGQRGCNVRDDDTDGDGTPNCMDQCPTEPDKILRGVCGCDAADIDSDGDSVLDCIDECPNDERRAVRGDCGCAGDPEPSGTACDDGLCAANNVCDGQGTCGDPQACAPDSFCTLAYHDTTPYWFCGINYNFSAARQHCQDVGMDLVAIEDAAEDNFVSTGVLFDHAWIGASDLATPGDWEWVGTGEVFWTGGNGGSATGYENWEFVDPDALVFDGDCAAKNPPASLSRWESFECSYTFDYVCERTDACPYDPDKRVPGFCGCSRPETDTDGDGTPDCVDGCPDDPDKVEEGICGCGVSENDADQDGIVDCKDECPDSADVTAGGQCGCPSDPAPMGTECSDGICGHGTCDGAGHCGEDPSTCPPDGGPSCDCDAKRIDGDAYWFCACDVDRDTADGICRSVEGGTLVQVDNAKENALVATQISDTTWLGANDRSVEGQWRWTSLSSGDDGRRFWDGDASGERHAARYSAWNDGEPDGAANENCAWMSDGDGAWSSAACLDTAGVVCEVGLNRPPGAVPTSPPWDIPGSAGPPTQDDTNCVPLETLLSGLSPAEREAQAQACLDCQQNAADPENDCINPWPTASDPIPCLGVAQVEACVACEEMYPGDRAAAEANCYPGGANAPDPAPCSGYATPPPPGNVCERWDETEDDGHQFLCKLRPGTWGDSPTECFDDASCDGELECGLTGFCRYCAGDGDLACPCDRESDCTDSGPDGARNHCVRRRVCGERIDACTMNDPVAECGVVDLCSDDTLLVPKVTTTGWNDPAQLNPISEEDITASFPTPQEHPDADALPGDPPCPDAPDPDNCPVTDEHRWCRYEVYDDVPNHETADPMRAREPSAGDDSLVSFKFTPEMNFDYNLTPGPFGLMKFDLGAHAALSSQVHVDLLGAQGDYDIIEFRADLTAGLNNDPAINSDLGGICGVDTTSSYLRILEGPDIMPTDFKKSFPEAQTQRDCIAKVNEFEEKVNRAKKAYFDAREMLRQYHDLAEQDLGFGTGLDGLADQIFSSLPADFPLTNLSTDEILSLTPEKVINAFIDYYEHWVVNEVLDRQVVGPIADAIDSPFETEPIFVDGIQSDEEIVLITSTFPVGPIPCTLQVLMTASYGLEGFGHLDFQPGVLVRALGSVHSTPVEDAEPLAYIGARAAPRAGAGLALFVGAGFDIGIAAAKIGIQGVVSLGHVQLPLDAGAGITVGTEPDERSADDEDPRYMDTAGEPLIPMKKYVINAMYRYGGTVVMSDILSGEIDAVVKIAFLFFSKTYKARLVEFSGFCSDPTCDVELFGGGGDVDVPVKLVDWGRVLMPTRFLPLKRLDEMHPRQPGGSAVEVGRAGQLFYDNLCTCIKRFDDPNLESPPESCQRHQDCCGYEDGDFCIANPADSSQSVCTDCRAQGESCNDASDCCPIEEPYTCRDTDEDSVGECVPKSDCLEDCAQDSDCLPTKSVLVNGEPTDVPMHCADVGVCLLEGEEDPESTMCIQIT